MFVAKKPVLIINSASGSTSDISEAFSELYRVKTSVTPECFFISSEHLNDTIKEVLAKGTDLIVTYGGDGTSLAAITLATPVQVPVIPLPGGTMNMLPLSLYGSDVWQDVLKIALRAPAPRQVPVGKINGDMFLVAAMIGHVVKFGVVREMVRDGDIMDATISATQTLRELIPEKGFTYHTENHKEAQTANLLQLTCPGMSSFAVNPDGFECASVHLRSYAELTALGVTAVLQDWRKNDAVITQFSKQVKINGMKDVDILLDGEHRQVSLPVTVVFEPEGALILVN